MLKDNDMSVIHHLSKVNVVLDALCRLSSKNVAHIKSGKKEFVLDVHILAQSEVCLWLGVQIDNK